MSTDKVPFNLRARRLARAEAQALFSQAETLESDLKSLSFKLNRNIKLLVTTAESYEFKMKMLGRERQTQAEYLSARYKDEIEKNKQARQKLEELAAKVRVLLQENDILKNDLTNPGSDLERIKIEMARIKESLREIGEISER